VAEVHGASDYSGGVVRRIIGLLGGLHRGFDAMLAQRPGDVFRNSLGGSVTACMDNKNSHVHPPLTVPQDQVAAGAG
jgi:hypothetical protein